MQGGGRILPSHPAVVVSDTNPHGNYCFLGHLQGRLTFPRCFSGQEPPTRLCCSRGLLQAGLYWAGIPLTLRSNELSALPLGFQQRNSPKCPQFAKLSRWGKKLQEYGSKVSLQKQISYRLYSFQMGKKKNEATHRD